MRVVGGKLASRTLVSPPKGVRPTSDRVRESLFMRLGDLAGQQVLDLYAGTGALGIEAISRGATSVVFVDRAAPSLRALRRNLEQLDLEDCCEVLRSDACAALRKLAKSGCRFDLVFADPPYASDELERTLRTLAEVDLLSDDAVVVLESPKRHSLPALAEGTLEVLDQRTMGDTVITRLVTRSIHACND